MPQSTGLSLDMSEGNRPQNRTHPLIPIEFGSLSLVLGLSGRALLHDTLELLGRKRSQPVRRPGRCRGSLPGSTTRNAHAHSPGGCPAILLLQGWRGCSVCLEVRRRTHCR
nr:hypothetical protein [Burkholderia cepacia]MCE4128126.1 hypothetical protein [Burkholderia cepacia]